MEARVAELSIIPVNTAEDLDRFVELPWSIYTPDSLWVPNLKKQDRELLSPGELDGCFTLDYYFKNVDYIFRRVGILDA